MISLTKTQVPEYLVGSAFYEGLADDEEVFFIPQENFKRTLDFTNKAELSHLFHTFKFWGLNKLPDKIIELLIFKPELFLEEVLIEFDVEFQLLQLYKSQSKCNASATNKDILDAAVQCGRQDVLEYVHRVHHHVSASFIKAAAENGHICLLKLATDSCSKLTYGHKFYKEASTSVVAGRGYVDCLRFLLDKGCPRQRDTCRAAAQNGQLACLKLAHERRCGLNKPVRNAAAFHGHLDCLKYTLAHGCPLDTDTLCAAAEGGQLECLQYLLNQGAKILKRTYHDAAKGGNVDCLKLLQARGAIVLDAESAYYAASHGHLAYLLYLLDKGCDVDYNATEGAARGGHLSCLELLFSIGCEARTEAVYNAAEGAHLACLKLLKKHNVPIGDHELQHGHNNNWFNSVHKISYVRSLFEAGYQVPQIVITHAVRYGDAECVEYIRANNLCQLTAELTLDAACSRYHALSIIKVLRAYNCPWDDKVCAFAAERGDLPFLTFAHEHSCPWDERTVTEALAFPDTRCLEYALKNGCPCSEGVCEYAASLNRYEQLKCLHEHGHTMTLKTCVVAAKYKYSECLTYAVMHGAPVDASICATAAGYVHGLYTCDAKNGTAQSSLQLLECAHKLGCPWDERTCAAAAAYAGGMECLKFAHTHGCPWDASTTTVAACDNVLNTLSYALEHGCPYDKDICLMVTERGCLSTLQRLRAHGCSWDERVSRAAAKGGHVQILRFCVENGCPIDAAVMEEYNVCKVQEDLLTSLLGVKFYPLGCRTSTANEHHGIYNEGTSAKLPG